MHPTQDFFTISIFYIIHVDNLKDQAFDTLGIPNSENTLKIKMPGGQLKGSEAREMYELKQQAVKYYSENGVPKKMEEILNQMFHDQPSDVYGHLVRHMLLVDNNYEIYNMHMLD